MPCDVSPSFEGATFFHAQEGVTISEGSLGKKLFPSRTESLLEGAGEVGMY